MAFKALNDTTSLDSLVPTLLVFGVYLWIIKLDAPLPTVTQCANVVKKAIVEIYKLHVEQQVANVLSI